MDKSTIIKLYERADKHQDAMVAWLIFWAAREADYERTGTRFGNGVCPYGIARIQQIATARDAWHEANRLNPDAWEAASAEASLAVAAIVAEAGQEMTVQEVADEFDIHRQTVHDAIRTGRIPARQSGSTWLVRRADAERRWGKRD